MLIPNINASSAPTRTAVDASGSVALAEPRTDTVKIQPAHTAAAPATPTAAQVQSAVDSINKSMQQNNSNLEFSVDHDTQKRIVKVVETGTGQVIRQFPSEEAIAIAKAIDNMQHGLLLRQKA